MEWSDIAADIAGLAHLATSDPDGHPAVAVVSAMVDGEVLWVQTRRTSIKARNVAANAPVAMMWQSSGETYVWGDATIVDDVATKERLWSSWPYDAAGFFGMPDNTDVVLIRVTPTRATVLAMGPDGPQRRTWQV